MRRSTRPGSTARRASAPFGVDELLVARTTGQVQIHGIGGGAARASGLAAPPSGGLSQGRSPWATPRRPGGHDFTVTRVTGAVPFARHDARAQAIPNGERAMLTSSDFMFTASDFAKITCTP